jgi:hypothetical protein
VLTLSLALAACGSAATPDPSGAAGTPSVAPSVGAASATPVSTTAADRLAAAFAGLAGGYTFDTTISVAGKVATHVSGRSVGGASEFVLESGGQSVTYRSVPPQAWVQKSGSGWVLVANTSPGADPLGQLTKPQATSVTSNDAATLVVDATYPPAALGLSGSDPVRVTLTVASDRTITATYDTQVTGGTATSTTVLKPAAGQQAIIAPSAAASASPGG